jgi:hypothetical protein
MDKGARYVVDAALNRDAIVTANRESSRPQHFRLKRAADGISPARRERRR